jgi:hypothetical protein
MKFPALGFLAIFACSMSFAETISLVCEHGGGISTRTGLPDGDQEIFPIEFDAERETIVSKEYSDTEYYVGISPTEIFWSLEFPKPKQAWHYKLNRYTGTLYLKRWLQDEIFVAKGRCVARDDKLF